VLSTTRFTGAGHAEGATAEGLLPSASAAVTVRHFPETGTGGDYETPTPFDLLDLRARLISKTGKGTQLCACLFAV